MAADCAGPPATGKVKGDVEETAHVPKAPVLSVNGTELSSEEAADAELPDKVVAAEEAREFLLELDFLARRRALRTDEDSTVFARNCIS